MHALRVLLVAALLVPMALPPAAAQSAITPTLTVSVTDPGEDLVTTRPTSMEVRVRYAYGPGGAANEPIAVTLEILAQPPWTAAKIVEPVLQFELDPVTAPTGGAVEHVTTVELTLDPLAPARERQEFIVQATSQARGTLASATSQSPPVGLQAKFLGIIEVSGPTDVRLRGGRMEAVPFVVKNAGNGDTDVELRVATQPESSVVEGVPGTITLARNESTVVDVLIRVPWTTSSSGLLQLEAVSLRAAEDAEPALGSVEVAGVSAVPASPVAALVALAAAVGLARRRAA